MEFDGVVTHGAGLDVHQKVMVATVLTPTVTETRSFGPLTPDLLALADGLQACAVTHVAMEATGVYWKPVVNWLEAYPFEAVMVVNPQHIKGMPGRKTDVQDSQGIASLLRIGALRASHIPPRPQRELRELVRYRMRRQPARATEANRIQKNSAGWVYLRAEGVKVATYATMNPQMVSYRESGHRRDIAVSQGSRHAGKDQRRIHKPAQPSQRVPAQRPAEGQGGQDRGGGDDPRHGYASGQAGHQAPETSKVAIVLKGPVLDKVLQQGGLEEGGQHNVGVWQELNPSDGPKHHAPRNSPSAQVETVKTKSVAAYGFQKFPPRGRLNKLTRPTQTHIVGVARRCRDVIRKQIFIAEGQNEALKRLAKKTGKSEGALIREALERRLMEEQDADALWEGLIERWLQVPMTNEPRTWTREDLYDERLRRFHVHPH